MTTSKSGIYRIVHMASGKSYIGSARNISQRWTLHRNHLKHQKHHSPYLQRKWNLDGPDAFRFDVLEYVDDLSRLVAREQYYLDKRYAELGSHEFNMSPTAGSPLGVKRTIATRMKWSAQRKGVPWNENRRAAGYTFSEQGLAKRNARWEAPRTEKELDSYSRRQAESVARFEEKERQGLLSTHPGAIASRNWRKQDRERRRAEKTLRPTAFTQPTLFGEESAS